MSSDSEAMTHSHAKNQTITGWRLADSSHAHNATTPEWPIDKISSSIFCSHPHSNTSLSKYYGHIYCSIYIILIFYCVEFGQEHVVLAFFDHLVTNPVNAACADSNTDWSAAHLN